jgi:signal peptidase I
MTARRVRHFLGLSAMAFVVVFWVLVLRPAALGGPAGYIIIRGSSMVPTYASGDLVIVRTAGAYHVGDVVAYRVPDGDIGAGLTVIHRIVGTGRDGFFMRGDNNASIDPWTPKASNILGKAWVSVPGFGRVLAIIHDPVMLAALAASVAAAIVVTWRPRRRLDPGDVRAPSPGVAAQTLSR